MPGNDLDLIGHPLFQLNLMLFLSLDIDVDSGIFPLLKNAGYSGLRIERNLPIPPDVRKTIGERIGRCNEVVAPDVLLEHNESNTFVPIECKRSYSSLKVDQTLGLLALNGVTMASLQGKPPGEAWNTTVTFLSTQNSGAPILDELQRLSNRIREDARLVPANACSLELTLQPDGVYMQEMPGSTSLPGVNFSHPVPVLSIAPGFDLRPLYLLPYVSKSPSEYEPFAAEEFREQLKLGAVAMLRDIGDEGYEYPLDDLIAGVILVWDVWENRLNKRAIRVYVRDVLRGFFRDLERATGIKCSVNNDRIIVPPVDYNRIRSIRRYLQRKAVREQELGVIQKQFDTSTPDEDATPE